MKFLRSQKLMHLIGIDFIVPLNMSMIKAEIISYFIEKHFRRWDLIIHWFFLTHSRSTVRRVFYKRKVQMSSKAEKNLSFSSRAPRVHLKTASALPDLEAESSQFEPWHRSINHICQYVEYSKYWILLEWAMVTSPTIFLENLYPLLLKITGRRRGGGRRWGGEGEEGKFTGNRISKQKDLGRA